MKSAFDSLFLEPVEHKTPHIVKVQLVEHSGRYKIGPPTRPHIIHDNGFLGKYAKHEPTNADRIQFAKWLAMLEASEAVCNAQTGSYVALCAGDLVDANAAYRHFLFGDGKERTIEYDRFLQNDDAGKSLLTNLLKDFSYHASIIGKDRSSFQLTSDSYAVSNENPVFGGPRTANWQKTIGAHYIWVSADLVALSVKGIIFFDADIVIHMEDRYNFNPGDVDAATGIPDSANGNFELCGLGKQYMMYGHSLRHIRFQAGTESPLQPSEGSNKRTRMPSDNRRLRNRN